MAMLQAYQDLVVNACNAVEFMLIRDRDDLDKSELAFHPAMAHQIFGDNETIFGYEELRVRILYTAGPLHIYLGVECKGKVDDLCGGDVKADNVIATVSNKMPEGCFFINLDEFLKTLDKADKFQPYGEKLCEFKVCNKIDGVERHFEIYHADHKNTAFIRYFNRLQTFILWFVDAATLIDVDDSQWNFFICYEKYKNKNGDYLYATAGYTTVYEYYAYPQNIRPRISQMLVLPPFQRLTLGTHLIESIYKYYQTMKNVVDITVEDPSPEFQRLRNFVDSRLCMDLKSFSSNDIKNGFTKEMIREGREILKLNPKQLRRVYEILRLYYTNINDPADYTPYRLEIKKRLNALYYKQMKDMKRVERFKIDTEWLRARLPNKMQRIEQLKDEYEEVHAEYEEVIKKLKA